MYIGLFPFSTGLSTYSKCRFHCVIFVFCYFTQVYRALFMVYRALSPARIARCTHQIVPRCTCICICIHMCIGLFSFRYIFILFLCICIQGSFDSLQGCLPARIANCRKQSIKRALQNTKRALHIYLCLCIFMCLYVELPTVYFYTYKHINIHRHTYICRALLVFYRALLILYFLYS